MNCAAVLPVLAAGEGMLPALFLALMIILWVARQFGGNNQQNRPLPRPPRPPGPGGRPPAGPRAPQEAAGQLQKEIEVFLGQIRQKAGRPEPPEEAAEPVFHGGRPENRGRLTAEAEKPRRVPRATASNEPAFGGGKQAEAARRQAVRDHAKQPASDSRTGGHSGSSQRDRQRQETEGSSRSLSTSELGGELRQHLKDYMTEDRLPKHLRDRLVDEVEAHLGRITGQQPPHAGHGASRRKLLSILHSRDQLRMAMLVNEILTPVSRRTRRR